MSDKELWERVGSLCVTVILLITIIRRTNRDSRQRSAAMREEIVGVTALRAPGTAVEEIPLGDDGTGPFEDLGRLVRPFFFVAFAIAIGMCTWTRVDAGLRIFQTSLAQLTLIDLVSLPLDAVLFLIVVVWWRRWAFSQGPKRYEVWGYVGVAGIALAIISTIIIGSRR